MKQEDTQGRAASFKEWLAQYSDEYDPDVQGDTASIVQKLQSAFEAGVRYGAGPVSAAIGAICQAQEKRIAQLTDELDALKRGLARREEG